MALTGSPTTSIDVGGAYFHGTPPTMEEGGRMVFAVVPPWLEDFAPYPATARDGSKNLLLVPGNMPGRKDAGRIWQARFDTFLRDYGMRQLVTDLRVWVRETPRESSSSTIMWTTPGSPVRRPQSGRTSTSNGRLSSTRPLSRRS